MGLVARGAALPQSFMFENKGASLFAMAFGTCLVLSRHGKPARRFHDVHAMGIVALGAIHFAFQHRMMLRQIEFRMRLEMAVQARTRVLARVYNELPSTAANSDMLAAWPVARFASRHAGDIRAFKMQPCMRAGRKNAGDVCVAVVASLVSNKGGALDRRRRDDGSFQAGARDEQNTIKTGAGTCDCQREFP